MGLFAAIVHSPLACRSENTARVETQGQAGAPGAAAAGPVAGAPGDGSAGQESNGNSGGSNQAPAETCVERLSPDFWLQFDEVPLAGDPEEITDFEFVPDAASELLLLDKQGRLRLYELGEAGGALLDQLQVPDVYGDDDCGAVSLAFDPAYADNRFIYVGHCLTPTSSRITRLQLDGAFDQAGATAVSIIEVGDPSATRPWHNVGSIGFDDASVMWALFGEKTISSNAQDSGVALGKLLRFVPSREPQSGGHEPAEGNDVTATDPNVYALGLRSPWQGARDESGRYWIGDVGANAFEELNLVAAPGENLGWPLSEGPCQVACRGLTDPLLSYGREADAPYALEDPETVPTAARSIWVTGPFPGGAEADPYGCNLRHVMLFGDFFTGWVRAAAADDSGVLVVDQAVGHLRFASAFARDQSGTLYATTLGIYKNHGMDPHGRLYRARPAAPP